MPASGSGSRHKGQAVRQALAALPAVDNLLREPEVEALLAEHGRTVVTDAARGALAALRARISAGESTALESVGNRTGEGTSRAALTALAAAAIGARLSALMAPSLKPVFNLTGTVLHTNLGRAPLPAEAIAAMVTVAGAANLEYDLADAGRGDRDDHVEAWLTRLTGAEAATVVNNNAAAVLLALNTLAAGREVPVSRGELIEIGGAFRMPDIMARAGCELVEVGTTNRTHRSDFEAAVNERTALLMVVHTSNYVVQGFTATVPEPELAELAHGHGLPFVNDLGSGTLVDLERFGLPHEPTPREAIEHGADLVTFSGDKLLGGPQCGIIVGRADLVARIKRNPMKRAVRLGKLTLAALEAVLRIYANPERLLERVPTLALLTRAQADIQAQAERVAARIEARLAELRQPAAVTVAPCRSQIGSGALPVDLLPSAAVLISPADRARKGRGGWVARVADGFRGLPVPVIGRIRDGAFALDVRCLSDENTFMDQLSSFELPAPDQRSGGEAAC